MPNSYIQYWKKTEANRFLEGKLAISGAFGTQFRRRGVIPGDRIWIVTIYDGHLTLIGSLKVGKVLGPAEFIRQGKHIVAEKNTLEKVRRVDLMDIAAGLRFKSASGMSKLEIVNEKVDAQQLQTLRLLTEESSATLQQKWDLSASQPGAGKKKVTLRNLEVNDYGAGFGIGEENRLVETAAINYVRFYYEERGWSVESVEENKCGYDLNCSKEGLIEHVEVKGVSSTKLEFIVTRGELLRARADPQFVLWVITRANQSDRQAHRYSRDKFMDQFDFTEIAYKAKPRLRHS